MLIPVPAAFAITIAAVLYAGVLMLVGAIPAELRGLFSCAQTTDHGPVES